MANHTLFFQASKIKNFLIVLYDFEKKSYEQFNFTLKRSDKY